MELSATAWPNVRHAWLSRWYDPDILEWHYSGSLQGKFSFIQTNFENRIYSLTIECGPNYPQQAPTLKFFNKVNLPCVNQANGRVDNLGLLKNWKETTTLEHILTSIKNEMVANKGLKQPPEEAQYWFVWSCQNPIPLPFPQKNIQRLFCQQDNHSRQSICQNFTIYTLTTKE